MRDHVSEICVIYISIRPFDFFFVFWKKIETIHSPCFAWKTLSDSKGSTCEEYGDDIHVNKR
jgi:hypothetical protein